MNTWDLIKRERLRLVDMAGQVPRSRWQEQSLCDAWTAQDVLAHLVVPLITPTHVFALAMVKSFGNFDRASERLAAQTSELGPGQLIDELSAHAGSKFSPPGLGASAPLTDVIVHSQDIAIPLGIRHEVGLDALRIALDFVTSRSAALGFIPRGRLNGLRLVTTDLDWQHGEGPVVEGSPLDLLLAVCGRRVAFSELSGEGTAELARRL